jgi:predicted dehydrogenase
MTPYRLGILGAGLITSNSHLPAALACSGVEVAALIDPVEKRAAQLASEFGISPEVAGDISRITGRLDGVIIATPNHTHKSAAIACIEAGADVLVEKPLASTYEDGLAIVECADRRGRMVAVGYTTRFRKSTRLLKTLLDRGYFGEVRQFVHQFGTPGGWAPLSAYNLDRSSAGGGVLVVTGTHFLDRMLSLWGYPDEAELEDDALGGPEANCTARFTYWRDGRALRGMARYSKTVQLRNGLAIDTEAGTVIVADTEDADIILRRHEHPDVEERLRPADAASGAARGAFQLQIEDFVRASRTDRVPAVDGLQGLDSLRLIEQLYATRRSADVDWYAEVHPVVLQ